jgi:hypothetical protein
MQSAFLANGIVIAFTFSNKRDTSRNTIQPNAHNGLGGFFAWPAQAWALLETYGNTSRGPIDHIVIGKLGETLFDPTECPQWLERPFPPGVAEPGHRRYERSAAMISW